MRSVFCKSFTLIAAASAWTGCAAHQPTVVTEPTTQPALLTQLRVVRGETTWVARGRGYELVGRSGADLVAVHAALDRAASFLGEIYPRDTVQITVIVRRMPAPGQPLVAAPPVPENTTNPQVALLLIDQESLEEPRGKSARPAPPPVRGLMGAGMVTPAVRAWLAERATKLTGYPARFDQTRGEADDPRVPAWATEMVGTAGSSEMIDNFTKSLAANPNTLIPLDKYFTMERPPLMATAAGPGRPEGEPPARRGGPPEGMGGGRGGMGGRGGGRGGPPGGGPPGGMGGGPPMGGPPGGGPPGGAEGMRNRSLPLQGPILFAAQSALLSKYFARSGSEIVGELIDAQITGKSLDEFFAKRQMGGVEKVEAEWRDWLRRRGDVLNRGR